MPAYTLGDIEPDIHPDAYIHPDADVIGDVAIGAEASIWRVAVFRGDDGAFTDHGVQSYPAREAVPRRAAAALVGARVDEGDV